MKRHAIILSALLAAALSITSVLAAAGGASDPLISLSYLNNTFRPAVNSVVQSSANAAGNAIRQETAEKMEAAGLYLDRQWADTWLESRVKYDDILYGSTGLSFLVPC